MSLVVIVYYATGVVLSAWAYGPTYIGSDRRLRWLAAVALCALLWPVITLMWFANVIDGRHGKVPR